MIISILSALQQLACSVPTAGPIPFMHAGVFGQHSGGCVWRATIATNQFRCISVTLGQFRTGRPYLLFILRCIVVEAANWNNQMHTHSNRCAFEAR
jgi:hypothetical protein